MTTTKKMGMLCASLLIGGAMAAGAPADDTSIAAGKAVYESVGCWACHGFSGQGANSRGIASGPRIDAKVYPREAFTQQLRHPANSMPPYTAKVLSDAQVEEIYAYLQSIPAPRRPEDIGLLQGR